MDAIGAEVGQKMRSAIKAKLMELGCYVDDELPDYIMVMVANKRTKVQMEDDLQLFLRADTKVFVEWLQQVLRKLKEVTITNPEVCSSFKELKRKSTMEIVEVAIKKEKKDKKKSLKKATKNVQIFPEVKSLTDEIPVQANKLVEKRNQNNNEKLSITIKAESSKTNVNNSVNEDNFDIPSLAEVNNLKSSQLEEVATKIKEARNRIVLMKSDSEDDDFINLRADTEELGGDVDPNASNKSINTNKTINTYTGNRILKLNRSGNTVKNVSVLSQQPAKLPMSERLGARPNQSPKKSKSNETSSIQRKKTKISLAESLREEQEISGRIRNTIQSIIKKPLENKIQKKKESIHKRLGLPSSVVTLPKKKEVPIQEDKDVSKSVMSVVQVKSRRPVSGLCQANKNLLLKAVAEAQKSVSQTPLIGKNDTNKPPQEKEALYTKKYREQLNSENQSKLSKIVVQLKSDNDNYSEINENDDENQYVPQTINKIRDSSQDSTDYIPSTVDLSYDDSEEFENSKESDEKEMISNHQFIVTLDGIKDKKFLKHAVEETEYNEKIKKPPSPIIFDKLEEKSISVIPGKLPKVQNTVKTKDRCKYWPNCRLNEACEFLHPTTSCKMFPMCKFGEKCLYIHPKCKFDASCTRKDCPYSHMPLAKIASKTVLRSTVPFHGAIPQPEVCKYYPNCSNPHCKFNHPKLCKFGKYCLNKKECNFSHEKIPSKQKFTWHSASR